jgi:hypothetical protein
MTVRAALVPGAPALLPAYSGEVDPVAELRRECRAAVADLVATGPAQVLVVSAPLRARDSVRGVTTPVAERVARHLLRDVGHTGEVVSSDEEPHEAVLLVANGTACRSEKAPGHLDERAFALDAALEASLREGAAPPDDEQLANGLWCFDLPVFRRLPRLVQGAGRVRYADDPFGVAYWVATWSQLRERGEP